MAWSGYSAFMSRRSPLAARLINRASRAAQAMGVAPPITPAALRKQAERATGLQRWHGPQDDADTFEAGLEALCGAVGAPSALNGLGRLALHIHVLRALSTRLRRVAAPAPSVASLTGPVLVVVGLPRSGTTLLHRLLARAPGTRALALWEVQHPIPPVRGPDRRRKRTLRQLELLHRMSPELEHKHSTAADAPEECFFLLDDALVSPSFPLLFPLEAYRTWRHEASVEAAYRAYRWHLLRFQSETPSQRLVLKAPGHAEHLSAIAQAVPEAVFVHTHRSPVATVASRASLLSSLHGRFTDQLDAEAIGRASLDDAVALLRGSQRGRAMLPPERLIDVRYHDLVADPAAVVARIHAHAGLPSTGKSSPPPDEEARRQPVHRYRPEDFGLTAAAIEAACASLVPAGMVPE